MNSGGYPAARWMSLIATMLGGVSVVDRAVNSATRRNPKNPRQQAAHRRRCSYVISGMDQWRRSISSISGVMGRRLSGWEGDVRFKPRRTYVSRGNASWVNGFGKPAEIWRWRREER